VRPPPDKGQRRGLPRLREAVPGAAAAGQQGKRQRPAPPAGTDLSVRGARRSPPGPRA